MPFFHADFDYYYMKKICFIVPVILGAAFLSVSCGGTFPCDSDEVTFFLPQSEIAGGAGPGIQSWRVILTCAEECVQTDIPVSVEKVSFVLEKNAVCAISAFPVTEDGFSEAAGYKPAGCIYPYQRRLSFLHGFSASVLSDFYTHTVSAGTSAHDSAEHAARFNWRKFIETVQQRNSSAPDLLPYNPWLLDKERILSGIESGTFSASYLGLKDCCSVAESEIRAAIEKKRDFLHRHYIVAPDETFVLIPLYLPHSQQAAEEKIFVMKYGVQEKLLCFFSEGQTFLVFVTAEKSGKIALAINSIPI